MARRGGGLRRSPRPRHHPRVRAAAGTSTRAVGVPAVLPGPSVAGRDHRRRRSLRTDGWRGARSAPPWTSDHTDTALAADLSVATSGRSASGPTATRTALLAAPAARGHHPERQERVMRKLKVRHERLPGIGDRFELDTAEGLTVTVGTHRSGRRDIAIGKVAADEPVITAALSRTESTAVAALLTGTN